MGNAASNNSSAELAAKGRASGKKNVLVTGGAGYIGSHTVIELVEAGFRVTIVDNLDNSSTRAVDRVRKICECPEELILFYEVDLMDIAATEAVFKAAGPFDACIHFAGLKAVGESVRLPLHYYANNITTTINLVHLLDKYGCHALAFSSSATVYGDPETVPIKEDAKLWSTNPYGKTKLYIEELLRDVVVASPGKWSVALLRYFNPVGAHESGTIGEDPNGIPNNLVPYVAKVAVGQYPKVNVFGNDYDTPDGTGVRDYIHVVDLAKGHVAAINKCLKSTGMGAVPYNLGTGNGCSVLEVIAYMEKASGNKIAYEVAPRRVGDVATCYADSSKAKEELGWEAKTLVEDAIASSWKWQQQNPLGYRTAEESASSSEPVRKCKVFQILS